jgi:anthranilate phosphoribosyltransferase
MMMDVLDNKPGVALDIALLNAGAALYTANLTKDIGEGVELARQTVASGAAKLQLQQFIACSQAQ